MKTQEKILSRDTENTEQHVDSKNFEVIENESLTNCSLEGITVSGALFSLTLFKNVTFRSCVFFASRMENCQFIACTFENCTFEFSNISYCDFHSTSFENCMWSTSPTKKNLFSRCQLDPKAIYYLNKDNNNNRFVNTDLGNGIPSAGEEIEELREREYQRAA